VRKGRKEGMHADEFAVSWKWSIGGKRDDEHVPRPGFSEKGHLVFAMPMP